MAVCDVRENFALSVNFPPFCILMYKIVYSDMNVMYVNVC